MSRNIPDIQYFNNVHVHRVAQATIVKSCINNCHNYNYVCITCKWSKVTGFNYPNRTIVFITFNSIMSIIQQFQYHPSCALYTCSYSYFFPPTLTFMLSLLSGAMRPISKLATSTTLEVEGDVKLDKGELPEDTGGSNI